jgi:hypothetical protein
MKITQLLKKSNVTIDDICAEIEGELLQVSFDLLQPLEYAGERYMIEGFVYGNRELILYAEDEDEPLIYVVDVYGDDKYLVET